MIIGEVGTGKEELVKILYSKGSSRNKPLVTIDCAQLNDKSWNYLSENNSSPLYDMGLTIYIKNSKVLTEKELLELASRIKDLGAQSRNKIIFTCSYNEAKGMVERHRSIVNLFGCQTFHIPPDKAEQSEHP